MKEVKHGNPEGQGVGTCSCECALGDYMEADMAGFMAGGCGCSCPQYLNENELVNAAIAP